MAGSWRVTIVRSADAELDALKGNLRDEALDVIADLADDPFPPDSASMRRNNRCWRLKFDARRWRILYRVDERRRTVTIFRIRPRGTAYKGLRNPLS